MANKEQLAILKQGVEAWNKWREENPNVKIDLREAKLDGMDLSWANFRYANINSASFQSAILVGTDFSISIATTERTIFGKMNYTCFFCLSEIYFLAYKYFQLLITGLVILFIVIELSNYPVYIVLLLALIVSMYHIANNNFKSMINIMKCHQYDGANFKKSNLTDAIFNDSNVSNAIFDDAIIKNTSFVNTKGLASISCKNTILNIDDVKKILFSRNGQGLGLKGIDLYGAYLVKACLQHVDLRKTGLICANLREADITGAKLWGSARENWIIDGIRCEYVYWDEAGEVRTPPDRDFRPGEFEELYKQLPSFEYVFAQGFTPLDPLIMDRVVQAINEQHKEFSLELVNFDKRGEPHATFTVCHLDYVEKAKEKITAGYEASKGSPEQQAQLMAAVLGLIENQNKSLDIIKQLGGAANMGDIYNISGGQIGAIGQHASASGNIFQQITAELSRLHEAMRNAAANPAQNAAADEVAKAEQAAKQQNEPKMRQHLKKAGKFAVDCAQKIGAEALSEYLKKVTLGM